MRKSVGGSLPPVRSQRQTPAVYGTKRSPLHLRKPFPTARTQHRVQLHAFDGWKSSGRHGHRSRFALNRHWKACIRTAPGQRGRSSLTWQHSHSAAIFGHPGGSCLKNPAMSASVLRQREPGPTPKLSRHTLQHMKETPPTIMGRV